jgi:hypothetical protein
MTTLTIPLTTLPLGSRDFGPVTIADAEVKIVLTIDRTVTGGLNSLTPASVAAVDVSQSNDGGGTWQLNVGGTFPGGLIPTMKAGNLTVSALNVDLAPGTSRRLKATLTVTGTPVAVAGTLVTT